MSPSAYVMFACLLAAAFDVTVSAIYAVLLRIMSGQWTCDFFHARIGYFTLALFYCSMISLCYGFAVLAAVDPESPRSRKSLVLWSTTVSLCVAAIGVFLVAVAGGRVDGLFLLTVLLPFTLAGILVGYIVNGIGQALHKRGIQ